jgi:phenylpropionate dioxygenase-like ring-hydroxylating dioxygenase large terminal subunit
MRLYWQPAALVEEFDSRRPIVPVRLLGEDFVLFRNEQGRYGLLDRACPHRGVDLCFGRLEHGGLRCAFHGWLFDVSGACLEQPAEPIGTPPPKVRQPSYPCLEKAGIVWAYLGPGAPPAFPDFDCFAAPDAYIFAFKGLWECNWMQALEVGIDPAHASFLHRFFEDEDTNESYGKQFRDRGAAETDIPMTRLLRDFPRPDIEVVETPYGMQLISRRDAGPAGVHTRVTNHIFPHAICVPMSTTMHITQWHVPIDNENTYWYSIFTSFGEPVDKALMREQRKKASEMPHYAPRRNKRNQYGFDPAEQLRKTYTGMGDDINVHDQWAVESPGPLQDRTREHLGRTDAGIVRFRRAWERAIRGGGEAAAHLPLRRAGDVYRGPRCIDVMCAPRVDRAQWVEAEASRRTSSAWARNVPIDGAI